MDNMLLVLLRALGQSCAVVLSSFSEVTGVLSNYSTTNHQEQEQQQSITLAYALSKK